MSDLQIRGYMLTTQFKFLCQEVGETKANDLVKDIPDRHLYKEAGPAAWYSAVTLNALSRVIAETLGQGDTERTQQTFFELGRFTAIEASSTFLKLLMRVLTPPLMAKRFPSIWSRDMSRGRAEVDVGDKKLSFRLYDVQGFDHCALTAIGFTGYLLGLMGKEGVRGANIQGWSLATPGPEKVAFELQWK
jgi:hypothetical protein